AINAGVSAAGKLVQKVLNTHFGYSLVIDGVIGTQTISAINNVNQEQLHEKLYQARVSFYESIGGFFLVGWLNRLSKFVYTEKKKIAASLILIGMSLEIFLDDKRLEKHTY